MPESINKGNIALTGSTKLPSGARMAVAEADASAYGVLNGNMN